MNPLLTQIDVTKPKALRGQIRDQIRELILSGQIRQGDKLPSTHELARQWQTHVSTVHAALTPLVREGLLSRVDRVGTFVRKREAKLTCVGIYSGAFDAATRFTQALQAAVQAELQRAGIEPDIWIDPRPDEQRGEPWMPMVRSAEHREFQAVIAASGEPERLRWLRKLPVPVTALEGVPGWVNVDPLQMADLGLPALAAQGCRSVGLILSFDPAQRPPGDRHNRWLGLCERFLGLAGELGMTVKNEWVRLVRQHVGFGGEPAHEQFGYEEFLNLWSQPERPAGLFVCDDAVARGVILGLREKQVRVPEDLKLVLHKNEAVDLFCPMPATFVVNSERQMAWALVGQVQKQFRGEPCEPVNIPYRLLAHPAAEQPRSGAHRGSGQPPTTNTQKRSQS